MLGEVISIVVGTAPPEDQEFTLPDTIADRIEAHVDGFRATLLDSVVDDTCRTSIIRLQGSGRLGMAHVSKRSAESSPFFSVIK